MLDEGGNLQEQGRTMQQLSKEKYGQLLSKEQYGQLLSILETFKNGNNGYNAGNINMTGGAVNFAGMTACHSSVESSKQSYESFKENADSWILESGATNHMAYNKASLSNIKTLVYPFLVSLPNGYKVKVTIIGDVIFSPLYTLKRVLYVPSFKFNLISVHSLTVQLDCIIIFTKFSCILLHDLSLRRPLEIDKAKGSLYLHYSSSGKNNSSTVNKVSTTSLTHNSAPSAPISGKHTDLASKCEHLSLPFPHIGPNMSHVETVNPTTNSNSGVPHQQLMSPELSLGNDINDNTYEPISPSQPDCQSSSDSNGTSNTSLEPYHKEHLKPPSYLKDYICNAPTLNTNGGKQVAGDTHSSPSFSFHTHVPRLQPVSLNALSNDSQHLLETLSTDCEPESYEEAATIPAWQQAMNQEYDALTPTIPGIFCKDDYRALVSIATKKNWEIFQLDVNNAFLHGDLNEEVYMQVPPRLSVDKQNLVCKLNKSLYGLKQASRVGNSVVFVAVYVDDVLLTRTNLEEIKALKTFLHETFKIKDPGRLHYFLGLEILYKHDGAIITQRNFTRDLIQEFECSHCTTMSSPLDPSTKLKANEGNLLTDPTQYRKLVGKLNFLTNTQLDIAYSAQHLSQYMQSPRDSHLKAAMHVLRYLKGDLGMGLFLSNNADYRLRALATQIGQLVLRPESLSVVLLYCLGTV
ncbi:PREDICTED: uncharacterized protein LOC109239412 [Nicotiana attenuata]|uniref:uncharacterized protein LOC109239412 n=1 Tax=Nicotiana attenuata TaxID=49451 RepID=UPI0009054498|nr:PREDICTED: uncharacterized protein LOC109239412 [Nicotiana attenuata]